MNKQKQEALQFEVLLSFGVYSFFILRSQDKTVLHPIYKM